MTETGFCNRTIGTTSESIFDVCVIENRKELAAMPMKPKKPCSHPMCPRLTDGKYCDEHRKTHSADRENASQRGYGRRWQRARARYLRQNPLCVKCLENGQFVEASVVDHIKPHRGNAVLFWDEGNWQSLCKSCHDSKTFQKDINPEYRY